MNANELADVMEKYSVAGFQYPLCDEFKQAATMIRQQQAEIEALKNILSEIDRQVFNIELRDDGTMSPVIRMETK